MKDEFNVLDLSAVVEQEKKMGYHRPRRSIEDEARKLLAAFVTDDQCAMYHTPEGVVCEKRSFHVGCKEPWVFKHKCKDLQGFKDRILHSEFRAPRLSKT